MFLLKNTFYNLQLFINLIHALSKLCYHNSLWTWNFGRAINEKNGAFLKNVKMSEKRPTRRHAYALHLKALELFHHVHFFILKMSWKFLTCSFYRTNNDFCISLYEILVLLINRQVTYSNQLRKHLDVTWW